MKILLAHNFYRSSAPSGEDGVYRNERAMLSRREDLIVYERHNDDIDDSTLRRKLGLALDGAWSRRTYDELRNLIRHTRPDVAHFHNTFPQISPSAYAACRDNGVPVVQTLHNYRLICPNALLLRDGKPCEDCVGKSLWPALWHRCYRGSLLATGAQVWALTSNRWRRSYQTLVNRYIALTDFAAERLIAGGLPAERMVIKPNFLPDPPEPGLGDGGYAIYVGRFSEEKGIRTLLQAWRSVEKLPLKLVGDGPLRELVLSHIQTPDAAIEWLGYLDRDAILSWVRGAAMQIVPSEWYEGFPMVILEAYACGTPVIASRIGSLAEVVREGQTGFRFEAGDAAGLAQLVNGLVADPDRLAGMRQSVRAHFEAHFTEQKNYQRLIQIYQTVLEERT